MKKILLIALAMTTIFTFTACGSTSSPKTDTESTTVQIIEETSEEVTEQPTTEEPTTEEPTEPEADYYAEGQYKVGTDIEPGQYILYSTGSIKAYYEITSDANGDNIIANNNFTNQNYITVNDGEYLTLKRCKAYSINNKVTVDTSSGTLGEGQYLVGEDLPAGEYTLNSTKSIKAYYEITSDANGNDIISNDNFSGSRYITVSDGQYLELNRCELKLN